MYHTKYKMKSSNLTPWEIADDIPPAAYFSISAQILQTYNNYQYVPY